MLHLFSTVQVWDRYLLPLTPMLALFVGGAAIKLAAWRPVARLRTAALALCLVLMLPPALQAAAGRLPVGGDHGAYTGLPAATAWLAENLSTSAILYHQTLGWHYRYYLYDEIRLGKIEVRWFPDNVYLADNAEKSPGRRKLLLLPDWASQRDLRLRLRMRGLRLQEQMRAGNFTVYELQPRSIAYCPWCLCTPRLRWVEEGESGPISASTFRD